MAKHNSTKKQTRRYIVNDNSSKNFEPIILAAKNWPQARIEAEKIMKQGYYNAYGMDKDQYIPYSVYQIPATDIVDKQVDYNADDSIWIKEDFTYTEYCTWKCAPEDIFKVIE